MEGGKLGMGWGHVWGVMGMDIHAYVGYTYGYGGIRLHGLKGRSDPNIDSRAWVKRIRTTYVQVRRMHEGKEGERIRKELGGRELQVEGGGKVASTWFCLSVCVYR